jgi:hypothetical protein
MKKMLFLLAVLVLFVSGCSKQSEASMPSDTQTAAPTGSATAPSAASQPSESAAAASPSITASPTVKPSPSPAASPSDKPSPSAAASPSVKPSPSAAASPSSMPSPSAAASPMPSVLPAAAQGQVEISFTYTHVSIIASNQYALWIENSEGVYIKTLFATHFTAAGGWKTRPDSLPVWVSKSGISTGSTSSAVVDAFTGATPKSGHQTYIWDCKDENGQPVPAGQYHFIVEGTVHWQDGVMYDGIITVGGEENTAQPDAQYTTENAKTLIMITDVKVVYKP